MRGVKILSIQSSVAYGHVGNSAAVFPLQRLGHEVWPVLTVHFSNHTGYGEWRGPLLAAEDVREVIAGIGDRGVLGEADAVLSGYQGDPAVGGIILDTVARVKELNPEAVYCCDPVMGDVGRGMFVRPGIPELMRDTVLPQADIVTPNHFELDFLAGRQTSTLADVLGVRHPRGDHRRRHPRDPAGRRPGRDRRPADDVRGPPAALGRVGLPGLDGPVVPDDEAAAARAGAQPRRGAVAVGEGGRRVDVHPREVLADDGHRRDARGWQAGARVDDVGAAVRRAGRRDRAAAYRHPGDQPLRPARVLDADLPGPAVGVGRPARHVTAAGQAEVGVGEVAQQARGPLDRPALHHAVEVKHAVTAYVEGAVGLAARAVGEGEHLGHDRRRPEQLARVVAGDPGVRAVGAEDPVDHLQLGDDLAPRGDSRRAAGVPAAHRDADRQAHDLLDGAPGVGHAWSSAL